MDTNNHDRNFGSIYARLKNLENEMNSLRGMHRDLHQMVKSSEAISTTIANHHDERWKLADAQRDRIEKKMDQFKEEALATQTRVLLGLLAVMLSIIVFFIIPFFTRS